MICLCVWKIDRFWLCGSVDRLCHYFDHALFRMAQQDRFISAVAWTLQMRNLYGMRAGRKTINNQLFSMVTVPIDPQGSPCWLPTNAISAWSGHRGGRTWQWPVGSMSSSMTSPDSNFTQYMAGSGYVVYQVSASIKSARLKGSKLMVFRYMYGELFTVVPNHLLCSPTSTSLVSSMGHFVKHLRAICQEAFRR